MENREPIDYGTLLQHLNDFNPPPVRNRYLEPIRECICLLATSSMLLGPANGRLSVNRRAQWITMSEDIRVTINESIWRNTRGLEIIDTDFVLETWRGINRSNRLGHLGRHADRLREAQVSRNYVYYPLTAEGLEMMLELENQQAQARQNHVRRPRRIDIRLRRDRVPPEADIIIRDPLEYINNNFLEE